MMVRISVILDLAISLVGVQTGFAQSNVLPQHRFSWGETIGWMNWLDAEGGASGVHVGETFLAGFVWAENAGWINMGDGLPNDGIHYANEDGTDFGVNIDSSTGVLFGLAWGENIGWINFETASLGAQAASLNLCTKRFHGYAWGENIGWINLDDAEHFVASELLADCNSNALEDACDPDFDGDELIDDCDPDIDDDGVQDELDACIYTPLGALIINDLESCLYGTLRGDYDGDCDVDLRDYALFVQEMTGPN